jgi:hypothetical protein
MPYRISRFDQEPIIHVEIFDPYDSITESPGRLKAVAELLEGDEKVYHIFDLSGFSMDFSKLVTGLGVVTATVPGSFTDPRLITVVVGASPMVKMGVEALKQSQYKGLLVHRFDTVEEALVYIRGELAHKS